MSVIKAIFANLSLPTLFKKCLQGSTQNANEWLNHLIWNSLQKTIFVGLDTLVSGVHVAVLTFDKSNISNYLLYLLTQVLRKLAIKVGSVSYTHLQPEIQTESNNVSHTALNCRVLKTYRFW